MAATGTRAPRTARLPKSNASYWSEELARTVARDAATTEQLRAAGWTVLRFWEHEDPDSVTATVATAVQGQGPTEGKPR